MQLVLSNNRVIAHGEGFLSMGGTVINTATGDKYDNATVAECENCPADIDLVGYEYNGGVFTPCAPYGKGNNNGYFMEVCETCATPRSSGIPIKDVIWTKISSVFWEQTAEFTTEKALVFPVSDSELNKYSMLRYRVKKGSYFYFGYFPKSDFTPLKNEKEALIYIGAPENGRYRTTLTFTDDILLPIPAYKTGEIKDLSLANTDGTTEVNTGNYSWMGFDGTQYPVLELTAAIYANTAGSYAGPESKVKLEIELEGKV